MLVLEADLEMKIQVPAVPLGSVNLHKTETQMYPLAGEE